MVSLKDIKGTFIVEGENFQEQELVRLVEIVRETCVLDGKGTVKFLKNLSEKDKIKYCLAARFLANKIDSNISKEVSRQELETLLRTQPKQVSARISDCRKEGLLQDASEDMFQVSPHVLQNLLNDNGIDANKVP
ncbi:hypothetical protein KW805_02925 [Candidatus Pacearchaeota archaeon]|nr:hypothetical protein [Candidatus Pacearchaeota archaeon]